MPEPDRMTVRPIAWTHFQAPADVPWSTDATDGAALVEFAGRACYETWDKPNPATAANADYLRHVLEVGHDAVFEHASVTFYLTGVPRSLTHELLRHRHFSYSELSPRFVAEDSGSAVEPDLIAADPALHELFRAATENSADAYRQLLDALAQPEHAGSLHAKQARQAARAVLPQSARTAIVVTGNYRAWRHFVAAHAAEHADPELRALAVACLTELLQLAPAAFADFEIVELPDATTVVSSPLAGGR